MARLVSERCEQCSERQPSKHHLPVREQCVAVCACNVFGCEADDRKPSSCLVSVVGSPLCSVVPRMLFLHRLHHPRKPLKQPYIAAREQKASAVPPLPEDLWVVLMISLLRRRDIPLLPAGRQTMAVCERLPALADAYERQGRI